jgi:hypothetical protein
MFAEQGGWLWFVIDVGLVAILGAALVYGVMMWRNRPKNRATEQVRNEATRDVYREAEQHKQG